MFSPATKETSAPGWLDTLAYLGDKNLALTISAAVAMLVLLKMKRGERAALSKATKAAITSGAGIIMITAAGAAFGGVLFDKQVIRQRLAMQQAKVDAGRQLLYHSAWLMEQGVDATREVSELKAYAGELVNQVLYDCVQFHGGAGYMRETPVERMSRDARVMSIGGGATEVMLEEVAKRSKV